MLPGRTEPFAKGYVNRNFAERMDVTATRDCKEGCHWENEAREEASFFQPKIFHTPRPSLFNELLKYENKEKMRVPYNH